MPSNANYLRGGKVSFAADLTPAAAAAELPLVVFIRAVLILL